MRAVCGSRKSGETTSESSKPIAVEQLRAARQAPGEGDLEAVLRALALPLGAGGGVRRDGDVLLELEDVAREVADQREGRDGDRRAVLAHVRAHAPAHAGGDPPAQQVADLGVHLARAPLEEVRLLLALDSALLLVGERVAGEVAVVLLEVDREGGRVLVGDARHHARERAHVQQPALQVGQPPRVERRAGPHADLPAYQRLARPAQALDHDAAQDRAPSLVDREDDVQTLGPFGTASAWTRMSPWPSRK